MKWFSRVAILGLLVGLGFYSKTKYCAEFPKEKLCAVPSPTPTPTPAPTASPTTPPTPLPPSPTPDPQPVCVVGKQDCGCYVKPPGQDWSEMRCEPLKECVDHICLDILPPTPPPPAPGLCGLRLDGTPVIDIQQHGSPRVFDATAKIRNANRCDAVGFINRQTCPTALEGDPRRYPCEVELMGETSPGNTHPVWEMRNAVGTLSIELAEDWFGMLYGEGVGEIRACYPNGKACSEWKVVTR